MREKDFFEYRDSNGKLVGKIGAGTFIDCIVKRGIETAIHHLDNGQVEVTETLVSNGSIIKRTLFATGGQIIAQTVY